ncbi:hypothetical protein NEOLEDRAFT_1222991 [Neolentinus lepideus HHB14362 ss-1]|uniref:Uncharacterized protein n=1 Tax=Neolentinus lepideus HHB14362 ss-1 TaxID=1314782 RepID=A0A165PTE1_9AGAM|nr:hypothetical protein NEOLEDRAFT_1222991 [Neolentinus lepideus HHB14362 ss-1]
MSCPTPVDQQQLQQLDQDFHAELVINDCMPFSPNVMYASAPPSAPLLATKALPAEDGVDDVPPFAVASQSPILLSLEHMDVDLGVPASLEAFNIFNNPSPSHNFGLFDFEYPPSPSTASTASSFDSPPVTPLLSGLDLPCLECFQYAQDGHATCSICGFTALHGARIGFEEVKASMEESGEALGVRAVDAKDLVDIKEDGQGGYRKAIPGLHSTLASKSLLDANYKFGQLPPRDFELDKRAAAAPHHSKTPCEYETPACDYMKKILKNARACVHTKSSAKKSERGRSQTVEDVELHAKFIPDSKGSCSSQLRVAREYLWRSNKRTTLSLSWRPPESEGRGDTKRHKLWEDTIDEETSAEAMQPYKPWPFCLVALIEAVLRTFTSVSGKEIFLLASKNQSALEWTDFHAFSVAKK